MAVTHVDYTGNGSETDYSITFPFIESSDVKASVAGVTKTVVNDYNISGTTLTFTSTAIPANNAAIRIYRNTNADLQKHTYQAGSSVKASNLNDNQKQVLYKLQELNEVTAAGTGIALVAGDKNDITVNGANDWVIRSGAVESAMLASGAVAGGISTGEITTTKIADDAITADKLANSINTEIAANTAKVTNATHTGEVTGATALTIADNIVDEANLKVDNTPVNNDVLTAKSGASGGLTWATLAEAAPAGWQIGFGYASTTTKKDFTENNTWDDSGLEITYTPKSSSSLLLIEARPIIRCRPSTDTHSAYFELRYELDNSGSDLDGAMGVQYGVSALHADYSYYVAQANQPILLTAVYTNSNTNQKIFKVQGRAPSTSADFVMNEDDATYGLSTGKSYITIKEISN